MNIPIELYSATRDHRPKFRLLHAKDESPVHYERVCQSEGKPVAWEDLVKGYEYDKGRFVVITRDDVKTAALEKTKHLAAVEAIDDALVLTMMRFADELVDLGEFRFPAAKDVRPAEMKMARQLIGNLAGPWRPAKYTDEHRDNLMRVIQAKLKGKRPKLQARATPEGADVVDLMTRLRASLEAKHGGKARKTAQPARKGASRGQGGPGSAAPLETARSAPPESDPRRSASNREGVAAPGRNG